MKKKFTKEQLDKLERLNYLSNKLKTKSLSIKEYDEHEELTDECKSFFPAIGF